MSSPYNTTNSGLTGYLKLVQNAKNNGTKVPSHLKYTFNKKLAKLKGLFTKKGGYTMKSKSRRRKSRRRKSRRH